MGREFKSYKEEPEGPKMSLNEMLTVLIRAIEANTEATLENTETIKRDEVRYF